MKMNKLVILVVGTAFASALFFLPVIQNKFSGEISNGKKCTTVDGHLYYGYVPEGVVCEKVEPVKGAVTVVKSQPIKSVERLTTSVNLRCDGRKHCSEMTSCKESMFFLRNCPNTEMDGDNDGVPCEKQWCNS